MERRFLKASEVLPVELTEAMSKALKGRSAYLWVPSADTLKRDKRDAYIQRLAKEGNLAREIADRLFVSLRTIRRVLAKMKREAAGLPSRAGQQEGHQ